jgi:hypothetical protein
LALTDHDTTAGLAEAIAAGERVGVRVIRGVELSTDVAAGECHILGYGIDPANAELQEALEAFRGNSQRRLRAILDKLRELGIDLPDTVIEPSAETGSAGRPHIARALIAAGHVRTIDEAFGRYLGRGRPAFVAKKKVTPQAAVGLVRSAGGLPVLAHPLSLPAFEEDWLPALKGAGLAGMEVWYGEYDTAAREQLLAVARRHHLLATGGSDYHGEGFREGRVLGSVDIPAPDLTRFLDALDESGPR